MEEYRLQFLSARTYSGQAYRVGELTEYRGRRRSLFQKWMRFRRSTLEKTNVLLVEIKMFYNNDLLHSGIVRRIVSG